MYYKIAQLILTPGKKAASISDIFIAQPDTAKEAMFGKIFILAEIEDNSNTAIKILNFIFEEINRNYYQNEKILLAEKIAAIKPEHIFEASLAKTNINLEEFIQDEKIKFDLKTLNITVGLIYEKNFHFTNTGKNKVLFVYKQKIKNNTLNNHHNRDKKEIESFEYKVSDVTKQTADKDDMNNEGKFFNNVVSGKILENSSFFISNEAFPEYISNKQLIETVTNLPPVSAVEQFKLILSNINSYVSFLGILIKSTSSDRADEPKKYIRQSTQESIINLNNTETSTENFLSPPGMVGFNHWLSPLFKIFSRNKSEGKTSKNFSLSLKDKIFFKKKSYANSGLFAFFNMLKDILAHLIGFVILGIKSLTSKESLVKNLSDTFTSIKSKIIIFYNAVRNLSKRNKILLALSLTCLLAFFINLNIQKNKNNIVQKNIDYQNLTLEIEQKQNQAEANLLYNNEEGAKKLFDEIKGLIDTYPQNTPEQKTQFNEFKNKYDAQLEKIRKIARIDDAVVLADYKNLTSAAQPENIKLEPTLSKIYAGDSSQKTIYSFDIKSKKITSIMDLKQPIESLKYPIAADKGAIYYLNNKNLIKLNTAKDEITNIQLAFDNGVNEYFGIGLYNGNLYALDGLGGQIFKHEKAGSGFGAAKLWPKDATDIKNSVDLAIDGSVYILKNNGELIKFLKGKKTSFTLDKIEPVLEKPTGLFLSPDKNFIYILEPAGKRIIIYDKNGKYIMQYYSDKFTDLKSFIPDEKNKLIYILNGTEILSFKATYL